MGDDGLMSAMSSAVRGGGAAGASARSVVTTRLSQTTSPAAKPAAPAPIETVPPEYVGASTRYDVRQSVTIGNDKTSMVLILSHPVRSDEVLLFAPSSGIPSSAEHPFRAIRFTNDGGELEPGSLAMFEKGVFVGQALLEPVPSGASATLPFALDRAVSIESERRNDAPSMGEGHLARVADGKLSIQVDRSIRTIYRLHNGGESSAKVLVRHGLGTGTKLHAPPTGTEERMGIALVPATVASHDTTELAVEERAGQPTVADWFSEAAGYAVRAYLKNPKDDPDAVRKLSAAWSIREDIVSRTAERDHLRQQAYDLKQEGEEIRRNMWASVVSTDALRAKVGNHLAQVLAQLADDDKKIVALESDIGDLNVKFKRAVQDVSIAPGTD